MAGGAELHRRDGRAHIGRGAEQGTGGAAAVPCVAGSAGGRAGEQRCGADAETGEGPFPACRSTLWPVRSPHRAERGEGPSCGPVARGGRRLSVGRLGKHLPNLPNLPLSTRSSLYAWIRSMVPTLKQLAYGEVGEVGEVVYSWGRVVRSSSVASKYIVMRYTCAEGRRPWMSRW